MKHDESALTTVRALTFGLGLFLASTLAVDAAELPFLADFDEEEIGLAPMLGGESGPIAITEPETSAVTVQSWSAGLGSQPLELYSEGDPTSVAWYFPEVTYGGLEATLVISVEEQYYTKLVDLSGPGGAKVRVTINAAGAVKASGFCGDTWTLATVAPLTPFALRLRFLPPGTYRATLDPELDGFDDDVEVTGTSCQTGGVRWLWLQNDPTSPMAVAFDDVMVSESDALEGASIFWDDFESGGAELWSPVP